MTRKTCSICNESKKLNHFFARNNKKSLENSSNYCSYCKICSSAYHKKRNDTDSRKHALRVRNSKNRLERNLFVGDAKNVPCQDCKVSYPTWIMDFDHRPGEIKVAGVSALVRDKCSLSVIQEEINKCDVVCSNCHRNRTHMRYLERLKESKNKVNDASSSNSRTPDSESDNLSANLREAI